MFASTLELIHRTTQRRWTDAAEDHGITHSEWEYLRAIQRHQNRTDGKCTSGRHLQDIAESVGVKKASASAMVSKLEARGLVSRVPCRHDARAQHLKISAGGRRLIRSGESVYRAIEQELKGRLSPRFLVTLTAAFEEGD